MEIFALIGSFVKAYPIATIVIVVFILGVVALFKNNNTRHFFCTDCGYIVHVQFHLGNGLYQTMRPCPRCGNNVASTVNTGQGRTYRTGGKNY